MRGLRKDLREWLGYMQKIQAVADGRLPGNAAIARAALAKSHPTEQAMAVELTKIIQKTDPMTTVPADLVDMAKCVLEPQPSSPEAQGFIPLLIIGGVAILAIGSITRGIVSKARNDRYMDCVEAGACDPPSQWKNVAIAGGAAVALWFLWTKTTVLKAWKA